MESRDKAKFAHKRALRGVYAAAGLAMLAFLAAIALSVDLASREADRFVLERELNVVRLEIDRRIDAAADRQAEFTYWDDAVDAIVKRGAARVSLPEVELEWVFEDLGFALVFVVDRAGNVKFAADQFDSKNAGATAATLAAQHQGLIEAARARYLDARVRFGRGFGVPEAGRDRIAPIHAGEIALVDDKPAILVAQAIVPESEEFALAEGEIDIAVAIQPIDENAILAIGKRLRLINPRIVASRNAPKRPPSQIVLPRISDAVALSLIWKPEAPRPVILRITAPFAAAIFVAICLILAFIVRRHGTALARLAESEASNRHLASHDPMTGLMNRSAFDAEIAPLADPKQKRQFGMFCIDLDRFKAVNDTYGHPAGDAVLCAVAARLGEKFAERGFVARLGGDEFIAVTRGWPGDDEAMWLADEIVEEIAKPVAWQGAMLDVGASIGVACWPRDGRTVRELVAAADAGLYAAKRNGRGRAVKAGIAEPAAMAAE